MYGRKPRLIAMIAGFLALAPSARGGDEIYGANVEASGRAVAGNPADNASITVNPGLLGLSERYDLHGHVGLGPDGALEWAVSAMDSRTSALAFGIAWRRTLAEPELTLEEMPGWRVPGEPIPNRKRAHELTAAFAYPFLGKGDMRYSFGINGTLRFHDDDRRGRHLSGNADVGLGVRFDERWSVGLAGSNLIPLKDQPDLPAGILAGARFEEPSVAAWSLDAGLQFQDADGLPLVLRTGGELLIGTTRPRIGYRFEGPTREHWGTVGVGADSEAGSVEYSLSIPLVDTLRPSSLRHRFSVRVRL
jgi:hypothetical protein